MKDIIMTDYRPIIQKMYDRINVFVHSHPDIERELIDQEDAFLRLSFEGCHPQKLFFDWSVFDYTLKARGQRLFDVFLDDQKDEISPTLFEIYRGVGEDRFSFFKVKAVKIGKQFICRDIANDREYHVFDTSFSKVIQKEDLFIGRLLPFEDAFILASQCLRFAWQEYDLMSVKLATFLSLQRRIDAYTVYQALYPPREPEKLSDQEKFELLCKEGGLSDDEIEDILLDMRVAIRDRKGKPQDHMRGVMEQLKDPRYLEIQEFSAAFSAVWNDFANQIHQEGVDKGPLETMLIQLCVEKAAQEIPIARNVSAREQKSIVLKHQQWLDEWFITPREELKGKTPKEVILQERRELGNPQEEFGFKFSLEAFPDLLDAQREKKAEQLFKAAAEQMRREDYRRALKLFEEYNELWDGNHVVWYNMGVCYVMLLQKRKAEKCLEKAWMINPEYDLAYERWEELKSMYKADMVRMVRQIKKQRSE